MTPEELKENGIDSLPESIGEAIADTERSTIVRQALGDHVFDHLIELQKEIVG
jgi:glutamine synthetase